MYELLSVSYYYT